MSEHPDDMTLSKRWAQTILTSEQDPEATLKQPYFDANHEVVNQENEANNLSHRQKKGYITLDTLGSGGMGHVQVR